MCGTVHSVHAWRSSVSETSSLHLIYYGALFAHLAHDSSHAGFTVYDSSLHHSVGMGTGTEPSFDTKCHAQPERTGYKRQEMSP